MWPRQKLARGQGGASPGGASPGRQAGEEPPEQLERGSRIRWLWNRTLSVLPACGVL